MKTLYIPCYCLTDPLPALKKHLGKLSGCESIGLIATAQHLNRLKQIQVFLVSQGKKTVVGGQVLGCDTRSAEKIMDKVDCFLCVGSGRFHPLAVSLSTNKPVYILNPLSGTLEPVTEKEKSVWLKKTRGRMARASQAQVFGVLVSTKTHQSNPNLAWEIKKKIEAAGRRAFVFAGDEVNPANVLPFKVDAWVNTACPRISDDFFDKPLVNPDELEHVL